MQKRRGTIRSCRAFLPQDAFYNFILDTWSPLSSLSKYLRPRYFLYAAATPLATSDNTLLCKVGYRKIEDEKVEPLINYLEKKSKLLALTNHVAAFIFVLQIPCGFLFCPRPEIAAEDALKEMLVNSRRVSATPSNREGTELPQYRQGEWFLLRPNDEPSYCCANFLYTGQWSGVHSGLVLDLRQFTSQQVLPFVVVAPGSSKEGLPCTLAHTQRLEKAKAIELGNRENPEYSEQAAKMEVLRRETSVARLNWKLRLMHQLTHNALVVQTRDSAVV